MDTNGVRAARNESTFRDANEKIERTANENWPPDGLVPFICECSEERCQDIIRLSLADYEQVRAHPRQFVVAPGHDPDSSVVAEHSTYTVIEKTGLGGAVAEAEDARTRPG